MNASTPLISGNARRTVGHAPVTTAAKMNRHFVTYDRTKVPGPSTAVKVATFVAAFFLVLTFVGIPLAAYLLGRLEPKPMDTERMQSVFERAVKQHCATSSAYIEPFEAQRIGRSHASPKPVSLTYEIAEAKGPRPQMEDAHFTHENDRCFVMGVFDGHSGGETSKIAAQKSKERIDDYVDQAQGNVELAMQRLIDDIHAEILAKPFILDGSTAVISYLDKASNRLYTMTLGDSEGNIYRKIGRKTVSIPLSLVQNFELKSEYDKLIKRAKKKGISEQEVLDAAKEKRGKSGGSFAKYMRCTPERDDKGKVKFGGISATRAIGDRQDCANLSRKVEMTSVQVKPGDTIILACDGLKDFAAEEEIVEAVEGGASTEDLVGMATRNMTLRDGDNVTVIMVKVEEQKGLAPPLQDANGYYTFDPLPAFVDD